MQCERQPQALYQCYEGKEGFPGKANHRKGRCEEGKHYIGNSMCRGLVLQDTCSLRHRPADVLKERGPGGQARTERTRGW